MKKIAIHPVSLIVWVWLLIVLGPLLALSYVVAIVIHEFGHFFVAKRLGYALSRFSISPYGVALSYYQQNLNYADEIKIAFAGPLANLISVLFVLGFWWIFPSVYAFTESFVVVSTLLALFNLLPAYPMDGGRIFIGCASHFMSQEVARKITIVVNIVLSILFFALFVAFMFINFNPTYLLFVFFLVAGVLDLKSVTKFEKINIFCKKSKDFVRPTIFCVSKDVKLKELLGKMQTSKTCVFLLELENGKTIVLSEKAVIKLLLTNNYDATLYEVLEKSNKK